MTTTANEIGRCKCGRHKSKYSTVCTKCHRAMMDEAHAKALAIVVGGLCPKCGSPLRRNSAMAGWWQCSQYGTIGFRADSNRPECSFQTFTE